MLCVFIQNDRDATLYIGISSVIDHAPAPPSPSVGAPTATGCSGSATSAEAALRAVIAEALGYCGDPTVLRAKRPRPGWLG